MKRLLVVGWILGCCLSQSWAQTGNVCEENASAIAVAKEVDNLASPIIDRFLTDNKLVFSDYDEVWLTLRTWDSRMQWTRKNVPLLKSLMENLRAKGHISYCVLLYGEASILLLPWPEGNGRFFLLPVVRRCAPYDEIMCVPGNRVVCEGFFGWRAIDQPAESGYGLKEHEKAIFISRISEKPKYRVIYVFLADTSKEGREDYWRAPQARPVLDFDGSTGKETTTGKFWPDSLGLRLLEADFSKLQKGQYTEDFQLGLPKEKASP